MNDKKKLIELFIYVTIVVVGIILLITSNGKSEPSTNISDIGGSAYVAISGE